MKRAEVIAGKGFPAADDTGTDVRRAVLRRDVVLEEVECHCGLPLVQLAKMPAAAANNT
jgi:hypothetical protein